MSKWQMDDLRRYLAALETGDPDRQLINPGDDVHVVQFAIARITELEAKVKVLEGDFEEAETLLDILQASDAAYNRQSVSQRRRILELRLCNKKLKARIEELEARLEALEKNT